MNKKTIDNIVWWIPFKKLRNFIRELILSNNKKYIDDKISIVYNDSYIKMRRLTPQPFIYFIEIHLAEHCNLACYSCNHFSQLAEEEYYDIKIFENDIRRLFELTNGLIGRFQLMGGEPLLNKNYNDYFCIIRKYFKNSLIWLITNGILLPKQDESFWLSCKENNVEIHPTKYPININWENIEKLCNKYGIVLHFYNDANIEKESIKSILNIEGKCDPFTSFINCSIANNCIFLSHGKLFTCGVISNIRHFNKYFNKNLEITENDYIDIYKAKNYNEILQFLAKPVPFCRYCDTTKWHTIGKWEISKRNINEYLL